MSQPSASPKASHPRWLRLTHWLNALAVLVMVTSGWRIYNASPIYDFSFPTSITLGGWLSGNMALAEAFVVSTIVLEVVVATVLSGIAISIYHKHGNMDIRNLRNLKG